MIQSMTGFGRAELNENGRKYTVEIKTVNHRFFDLNIKMPKKFNMFEADIRNVLKEEIQRGKIDLYITYENLSGMATAVRYNADLASQYVDAIKNMADEFDVVYDLTASKLSRYPEIIVMEEEELNEEQTLNELITVVKNAVKQLVVARVAEGERLKTDIIDKLDILKDAVGYIEMRSPEIIKAYQNKLEQKVSDLLADSTIEPSRIVAEVTIYADKVCVDEEIVRLKSHIEAVREALNSVDSIGRKLDFIVQEMNREANTILSKANNIDISDYGIALKTEIEKIREQIQNIE